ncbi:MAG: MG2 domain-containing protein [Flavobacteriales bacterium]|nr:MG2 domain-containing protein [Flavobacteriales bacterium]
MKSFLNYSRVFFVLLFALLVTSESGCRRGSRMKIDPAFAKYIAAFTGGTISAAGNIRICLTEVLSSAVQLNSALENDLFDFSPAVEGKIYWIDNRTIEFRPDQWLKRGKLYKATFDLAKVTPMTEELSEFKFDFAVLSQQMAVEVSSIRPYGAHERDKCKILGELKVMDVCDQNELTKTINATQNGAGLPIEIFETSVPNVFHFAIDQVIREEKAGMVEITVDGGPIQAEFKRSISQRIPSINEFTVVMAQVVQQPEQYVRLVFSDPLDTQQKLDGLITLSQLSKWEKIKYTIDGNEVLVYPPNRLSGNRLLKVFEGIKSIDGKKIQAIQEFDLVFEDARPAVRLSDSKKVILPSTDGLVMPFETVNLRAVDVRVIQLFENNIPQFLQVNELDGNREMKRVGRTVKKTTVQLNPEGNKNLAEWNTFFLDLNSIMKADKGAIYRIELSYRKIHSLYNCPGDETAGISNIEEDIDADDDFSDDEFSYWDYYDDYYYDGYDYYDWRERDNPCSPSYFNSERQVAQNLLSSDLGIIAKKGSDGRVYIAISDLRTTLPLEGVDVEIINYQQQSISRMKTASDGTCIYDGKEKSQPFLVIASRGDERGYLKLDGGKALSVSRFDVSGAASSKGLKGIIYGERGVWRPGDTLFLSFMLEDEKKALPAGHPVSFELINPRGQTVQKMVKTEGVSGLYSFVCTTHPDAETGNYSANVRVGGATFSKSLKVENIKPNRLKLALNFGKDRITSLDENLNGVLEVKWLHGAPAKFLKANVSSTFMPMVTSFERYKDFNFDDPYRKFDPEEQVIFEGELDGDGKANVQLENVSLADVAPGMVNANFSIKVFEEGGDFSVDRFSIPYAPYSHFVGMKMPEGDKERGMLLTDTTHKVSLVSVDSQGKGTSRKGLEWAVYKVEWRWWWEQNSDDLSRFTGSQYEVALDKGTIDTDGSGQGSFKFKIKYPNWGRYLIRVFDPQSGHATGEVVYVDWPGWAGRAGRENPDGATMLMFNTNKEKYSVGEKCEVSFPSSGIGRALVSIENANGILESYWVNAEKDNTRFSFTTKETMAPNAYVSITLIQPHAQTANDLPIRLYGVVPLFVENPNSHLEPVITMVNELEPEKKFDIKVTEKKGKGMSYTLAVVDEGLLDLTRFKTPDPWNHFYSRQTLGVNTFDMYDQVIGAFGSKIDQLLSIGGSDYIDKKDKNRANRFKPVVMYLGPFYLEPGQSDVHHMTMPNYVGSVRVMVVAGKDRAYGSAEKSVPVKKPLMVLASLPRVVGPGEDVKLPVTVFVMDKKIKDVKVEINTNQFLTPDLTSKVISFKNIGDQVVNFNLKVAEDLGIAKVNVKVSSGEFSSTYDIELDVRNPNPYQTRVKDGVAESGSSVEIDFDMAGMKGTNEAYVEISSIPAVDFGRRLKYLMQYPHGCAEQIVSAAFPQLFVQDVMDISEEDKNVMTANVNAAIRRLFAQQSGNGGITYWPGMAQIDEYVSSYVGHFLLEAKTKGYQIPDGFISSWVNFQKTAAQNWQAPVFGSENGYWRSSTHNQAYRLYTLALAGLPDIGAMNRLRELSDKDNAAAWRLAGAYALAGQVDVAKTMVANLPTGWNDHGYYWGTYGSYVRDEAVVVEVLSLIGDRVKAAPMVKALSTKLSSAGWYSTQTTAYSLLAISKFAGKETGKEMKVKYTFNGKTSNVLSGNKPIIQRELSTSQLKGNKIKVENVGSSIVFVRVVTTGQPVAGQEIADSENLYMSVDYTDIRNNPIDVSKLEQGTDFLVWVTISHPGAHDRYDDMALTQVFPSGWEIINSRMDVVAAALKSDRPEYQDFRDDRVLTYFDLPKMSNRRFAIKLNASYLGKFYLPSVNCEAMYDNTIYSHTAGKWVEVVPGTARTAAN